MLNPLQEKLLEMLKWLSSYIEEHGLRYYVIGGTFLGAVRHKGFIPWDDDIDIAMPRSDYQKLINLLSKRTDHYIVEYPNGKTKEYMYNFAKLYDVNTTMIEKLRMKVVRGVYIDIFPLDGLGNTYEESIKNYKIIDRYNMLLAMRTCSYRKDRKWWKNLMMYIGRLIPISPVYLAKKVNDICMQRDFDKKTYVANCMSPYRSREILEKRLLGNPTNYQFEDIVVKGPELADEYLTTIFKNWKELPPENKRKTAHDFIYLDLKKSYLD